jgi:murein DD-endopeptidase MepM/ murein hydrolase activator NlpD
MKAWLFLLLVPASAAAQTFTFEPPGDLVTGSGSGLADETVHAPGMRYPVESAPSYANSQVWGRGGSQGGGGSQCDAQNFSYPWRDNYCETRSWDMPLCPSGRGHQGQDIRGATCANNVHWVVAVEAGTVTSIGDWTVYVTAADGTRFDYLHMGQLQVTMGQAVQKGQRLGKVSNVFGGTPTTVHLHFNIRKNVQGVGMVFVSPYMSLVRAYEELLGVGQPPDAGPPPAPDAAVASPADAMTQAPMIEGDVAGGCALGGRPRGGWLILVAVAGMLRARRRDRPCAPPLPPRSSCSPPPRWPRARSTP